LLECKSMAPYNFISSPPLSGLGLAYSANRTASRRSRLDDYQVFGFALLSGCEDSADRRIMEA
jgi:hypothetical protein